MKRINKIEEIYDRWRGNFITDWRAMYEISCVMECEEVYAENVKIFVGGKEVCTAKSMELLIERER